MFSLTTGLNCKIIGGTNNVMTEKDRYCFDFDGNNDYIDTGETWGHYVPFQLGLMKDGEFTIVAWIKLVDGTGSNNFICGAEQGANDYINFNINTSGYLRLQCSSASGETTLGKQADAFANGASAWSFVAGKLDTNKAYTSINGSSWRNETSGSFNKNNFGCDKDIFIAANNDDDTPESFFEGRIATIMFFDKALSQTELDNIYNSGDSIHPKYLQLNGNLIMYYLMGDHEDDTNTVLKDDSGNGNHAVPTNMLSGDLVVDGPV